MNKFGLPSGISSSLKKISIVIIIVASLVTFLITTKSILDFDHSGPQIRDEVLKSYFGYSIYTLARLAFWAGLISAWMAGIGTLVYISVRWALGWRYRWYWHFVAAGMGVAIITALQFVRHLLYIPASIVASFNYRISRLYPLWEQLNPARVLVIEWVVILAVCLPVLIAAGLLWKTRQAGRAAILVSTLFAVAGIAAWAEWSSEPRPVSAFTSDAARPNILMIGSDTLRADRLGVNGNSRGLTPHIDQLAAQGGNFSNCYVPLARTGPSLVSMMTSTWPTAHGIRDNFVADTETHLSMPDLPKLLVAGGYRTAAIGDWAASDLGKFHFGFQETSLAEDQWNLKYLLRQGPKDLRLFLTLFTHNRFGKTFMPELYYLAGVPLTEEMGRDARHMIRKLADERQPFFMNVFIASTHGPFGAAYPYYGMYADPKYAGESRFTMAGLGSVEDVVKQQAQGKQNFDVQQILNLYDGSVRGFDDEVGRILDYLRASGLDKNTIVVVYSDHGVDLFEDETWGQGNVLTDYGYRIPLVIHDPRQTVQRSINTSVRSIDLAPTLLELAGLGIPSSMQGASLAGIMRGTQPPIDRPAYAETGIWIAKVKGLPEDRIPYPPIFDLLEVRNKGTGTLSIKPQYLPTVVSAKARMMREGRWQLVYFPLQQGARYQLFDMQSDPDMKQEMSGQHPDIALHLRAQLDELIHKDLLWTARSLSP